MRLDNLSTNAVSENNVIKYLTLKSCSLYVMILINFYIYFTYFYMK